MNNTEIPKPERFFQTLVVGSGGQQQSQLITNIVFFVIWLGGISKKTKEMKKRFFYWKIDEYHTIV